MANSLGANNNRLLEGIQQRAFLNRRMHIRYELEKEIQYVINDYTEQSFKGIVINISDSGIGLFVFEPLKKGQEINIQSDNKSLNRKGIVRRCREMGDNIYKVGLEFIVK